jgi:hypothetical protein
VLRDIDPSAVKLDELGSPKPELAERTTTTPFSMNLKRVYHITQPDSLEKRDHHPCL